MQELSVSRFLMHLAWEGQQQHTHLDTVLGAGLGIQQADQSASILELEWMLGERVSLPDAPGH